MIQNFVGGWWHSEPLDLTNIGKRLSSKKCNISSMYISVLILLMISLSDTTANPEKNYLAKDHNTESSLSAGKIKLVKDLDSLFSLLTVYLFTLRVKLVTSH